MSRARDTLDMEKAFTSLHRLHNWSISGPRRAGPGFSLVVNVGLIFEPCAELLRITTLLA
jgi:hypothetical protein